MSDPLLFNPRVLIVDDNPAIHADFRKILIRDQEDNDVFEAAAFGRTTNDWNTGECEIDAAYQGREALESVCRALAEKRPYAVAFMDVRMPPGWDGIETTARIWEKDPDLQIVLCTAYSDYSWDEVLQKLGRSDRLVILKKPFDNIEVLQLVDSLAKKWQLRRNSKAKLAGLESAIEARTAQVVREQTRFKAIFENSPVGIFQTTPEGRILCANPAFTKIAGYSSSTELLERVTDIDRQLYVLPERRKEFKRLLERDGIVRDFEVEIRVRDNSRKWVSVTAFNVKGADGALLYYEGFLHDVTERNQAEQERKAMEIQLRHSQKMESIGQLVAGIAHEINTPMQYVGDNVRFLNDSFQCYREILDIYGDFFKAVKTNSLTPDFISRAEETLATHDVEYHEREIPAAIEECLEGVARITKIVRAMKEFSHPGVREMSAANLNQAIETTATVARNEWKYVAGMNYNFDPNLPSVPCFIGEFNQVILNLIINAAHAIGDVVQQKPGEKGAITITTRLDGDWAEVRVSDTGTGIPEAIRPRIFEPFFTTKGIGKGTGQGLSIVYGIIVKQHGGAVSFESEPGKGTTFVVRLPIARRAANPPLPQEASVAN